MENEIIVVTGLTKKYGQVKAVENLNITVKEGEIFGLLGSNGAGKSTTIECMLGLKKRDSGSVQILKMNPLTNRRKLFNEVGVQFQESYYPDRIKVKEMCELTSSLYNKPIDWMGMLKRFELNDKTNQTVSKLSGGERQKLSVILALLHNPKVVFLDELTTGLDPAARKEVWKFLKGLKEKGLTIFLTSHYMDEVHYLCDNISILNKGREIITGTPDEVIQNSGEENLEEAYLKYIKQEVVK